MPWALSAAFLFIASCGQAIDFSWRKKISSHFTVYHQDGMLASGLIPSLESMHTRLRRDLSMFSPWMAHERINLYLYSDKSSYLDGEYQPPAWSEGIALHHKKVVAVYNRPERKRLMETISHETTHLLFESYWAEPVKVSPSWSDKQPPRWLDEGLAMMEECDTSTRPENCEWYRAMAYLSEPSLLSLEDFFKFSPASETQDQDKVSAWYTQAYSLVHFLYRKHSRLEFKNFVSQLRSGRDISSSLWRAYRLMTLPKFEKAWRKWVLSPEHRSRVDGLGDLGEETSRATIDFKPIHSFHPFK